MLRAPVPPPQEDGSQHHKDYNHDVKSLHALLKPIEMAAEKISSGRNNAHPHSRTQKIENGESPPGHSQHARHRTRDYPHPEYKARKKYGGRPKAFEQPFASLQCRILDSKD
jgi:hypothetical protein